MFWIGFCGVFILFLGMMILAKFAGKWFDRLVEGLGWVKIVVCASIFTMGNYILTIIYSIISMKAPQIINAVVCAIFLVVSWVAVEKLYELIVGKEKVENVAKVLSTEDKNLCHLFALIGVIITSIFFYIQNKETAYFTIISIVLAIWIGAYVSVSDIFGGLGFFGIIKEIKKNFACKKSLVKSTNIICVVLILLSSMDRKFLQLISKMIDEIGLGIATGTIVLLIGLIVCYELKQRVFDKK